jgi:hypothetical protein
MVTRASKRKKRVLRLVVIPEPAPGTRTVMNRTGEGTVVFAGQGGPPITMVCGNCGAPLIEGMAVKQIQGFVLRCNRCGAYNETLIS